MAVLKSNNRFDEFNWKSETTSRTARTATELALDTTGTMTVKKFEPNIKDENYLLNPAAIPEVFLELVFGQLLEGSYDQIVVDIIEPDGSITPALVSKDSAGAETAYLLRLELLNGTGFRQKVWLDDQKRISKILLQQKNPFTLERTSLENILNKFPERADYLRQRKTPQ